MPTSESCSVCRFWRDGGICCRRAPVIVDADVAARLAISEPDSESGITEVVMYAESYQPNTNEDDWCGEFEVRAAERRVGF